MSRTTDCQLNLYGLALRPVKIELKNIGAPITTSKIANIQFWGGAASKSDVSKISYQII